jgi:hypothetical protein
MAKRLGVLHGTPYMAIFPLSLIIAMLFLNRFRFLQGGFHIPA